MAGSAVKERIIESLGSRLDGWSVEASADPVAGWNITLSHPASAGLIIETGTTVEADAVETSVRVLTMSRELEIARAAPDLVHSDLVVGLRTVASAFRWDCREVAAVAFLMSEHGHLTLDETSWLSGFEGIGAPMQPSSPLA
jgi:hypothetical protein